MKLYNKILVCVIISLSVFNTKVRTEAIEIRPSFEQEITRIFGSKAEIALAVFEHESNNDVDSINYNCRYNGKSTFCKKGDKGKAWSVDCGVAQINFRGQVCPPQLLTKEGSIPYIEKIYKEQGLRAWVSFNNKKYKQFL